jgi:hypothetical protein
VENPENFPNQLLMMSENIFKKRMAKKIKPIKEVAQDEGWFQ